MGQNLQKKILGRYLKDYGKCGSVFNSAQWRIANRGQILQTDRCPLGHSSRRQNPPGRSSPPYMGSPISGVRGGRCVDKNSPHLGLLAE